MEKDTIYSDKKSKIEPFRFTREVTAVFDDMLHRSVPLYAESIQRQAQLAGRFYQENSLIYDLGCSHGNIGMAIISHMTDIPFSMVGVDSSMPMIEKYKSRLRKVDDRNRIELICGRIEDINIENASVVLVNLTLQFLNIGKRDALIKKIYTGLNPGGVLILTEKTVHSAPFVNEYQIQMYETFKVENGYSRLEISQKREALDKILVPETTEAHLKRLQTTGFSYLDVWLKWFNFASLIAVK